MRWDAQVYDGVRGASRPEVVVRYEVRVAGPVDPEALRGPLREQGGLGAGEVVAQEVCTVVEVDCPDQAALHGLLHRLWAHGLQVLAVRRGRRRGRPAAPVEGADQRVHAPSDGGPVADVLQHDRALLAGRRQGKRAAARQPVRQPPVDGEVVDPGEGVGEGEVAPAPADGP